MATTQLLEINPQELKFPFELRKPSSCSILLSNNSDQCLAFKIKTTSPRKYSVRPNVGIIKPNSTCDFTVTMQAQQVAPPNMQCKDKFLIQSTTVPYGTSDKNITSDMFAKDSGNYVEEKKIRVVLVRPLQSPVLLPINRVFNQEMQLEASSNKESRAHCGVENIPPTQMFIEGSEAVKDTAFMVLTKDVDLGHPHQHVNELQTLKDTQKVDLFGELRDLKSNMALMESKLIEAELTIEKLNNERKLTSIEKERLSNDLEVLKKSGARKVQQGFPFFFVCMVALISLTAGYLARS